MQAVLDCAAQLAEGRAVALQFVRQSESDPLRLNTEIQEVAVALSKPLDAMNGEVALSPLYQAGYLAELQEALAVLAQNNKAQSLPLTLRGKAWTAQGVKDALRFVLSCNAESQLATELQETRELLFHPSPVLQGPMSPYTSTRLYKEGYLEGLEWASQLINPSAQTGRDALTWLIPLYRAENWTDGRHAAFQFVRQCQGDAHSIQARIEWYQNRLSDATLTAPGQPYAPNTDLRLYADGHLAGLRDALTILTQATNGSQADATVEPTAQPPSEPHAAPSASAPTPMPEPAPDPAPTPDPA